MSTEVEAVFITEKRNRRKKRKGDTEGILGLFGGKEMKGRILFARLLLEGLWTHRIDLAVLDFYGRLGVVTRGRSRWIGKRVVWFGSMGLCLGVGNRGKQIDRCVFLQ